MPTRNEAFGLVFQEAAGGRAAGHRAGPQRHSGDHPSRRDGAACHASLFASVALRRRLGARAREVIEATTNPQAYMARLTEIINAARMR
ncbi:MAG TPA: hypothetical protein VNJ04_05395 [Gemmatimonadaceae bacterium]|nr:hypothetical protein [Gemmatimonadaceae bacterium]